MERSDSMKSKLVPHKERSSSALFKDLSTSTTDEIVVPGTSGKPDKVYKVVSGLIPGEMKESLVKDFSEYERHEIFHRIDVYQAECHHERPKALWIFGPPAVGKTTISNERASDMFGWPDNAVTVDGADFRMVHKGFQMVAQHGLRNDVLHADAWKMLKGTGFMDTLKEEVVELAIKNRQHLKIPETALNLDRVNHMLDQLIAAGYEVDAVCLWAPKSETEARGRARGVKDGKAFTTKEYRKALTNAMFYGNLWLDKIRAGDSDYKSVMFYDNTVFPSRPVHFSEFQQLVEMSDSSAENHVKACKAQRNANIQSEIAASEVRTNGGGTRAVITAALSAWHKQWTLHDDECVPSESLTTWSLSHPHQVAELAHAERRRGHLEGICAGLFLSIFAAVAKSWLSASKQKK